MKSRVYMGVGFEDWWRCGHCGQFFVNLSTIANLSEVGIDFYAGGFRHVKCGVVLSPAFVMARNPSK